MTNWAKRGKEALKSMASIPNGYGEAEGGEQFIAFYQFKAPTKEGTKGRKLEVGDAIEGSYAGTYPGKDFNGDPVVKHKFRTEEGLVGLPPCASINNKFQGMQVGTRYYIVYDGLVINTTGNRKGKESHRFSFYPYKGE
jgi:hypothetical protein